jgi:nucleoside-diphosphate-sugar epimerase
MKIALTGGTGFVGRALVERLGEANEFRCLARDVSAASTLELDSGVEWVSGDLGDDDWQSDFVAGCDAVVHSGLYRTTESFQGDEPDVLEYLRVNFLGTLKLIEAAKAAGVKRFVFVSTCAVHQRILDDRPLDESHPLWVENHYGAHKAAIEEFVHSYGFGQGFNICALRPSGIYGRMSQTANSKWYRLVCDVADGKDVSVSRGGKEVHVDDVAKAIGVLLHTDRSIAGEAFSCCDRYISEFEVAQIAKELTASSSEINGQPKSAKHQIETAKLQKLGMEFGGIDLLRKTIAEILEHRS